MVLQCLHVQALATSFSSFIFGGTGARPVFWSEKGQRLRPAADRGPSPREAKVLTIEPTAVDYGGCVPTRVLQRI
jgi:hypothetical protein